jgi:hypothetical protein
MKRTTATLLAFLAAFATPLAAQNGGDTSDCPPPLDPTTPLPIADEVTVGGMVFKTAGLPPGLVVHPVLGLIAGTGALDGSVIHRTAVRILETRGLKTPGGDYLVMFPEGDHYANNKGRTRKNNKLLACRSSDRGRTWSGPAEAFDIDYSQHGFIPFVPRGGGRIYAFGTQPNPDFGYSSGGGAHENAPIGCRWSDDDGRTWSPPAVIRPVNDPGFMGMSVMRMTETDAGTWLLGSHTSDWSVRPLTTGQYLLRSTDRGATWELLPGKRPGGWQVKEQRRMDEGRPINLGGGEVLFMSRTGAGSLFTARSLDDGKTWSDFAPTTLVHPWAPPMLFHLSDGKTLIAFHHNRLPASAAGDERYRDSGLNPQAENMKARSEIWFSLSTNRGRTWSESRFLFATTARPNLKVKAWNFQCSYVDMFTDGGVLHLVVPHRWQQVLHLTIPEARLATAPTKAELRALAKQ